MTISELGDTISQLAPGFAVLRTAGEIYVAWRWMVVVTSVVSHGLSLHTDSPEASEAEAAAELPGSYSAQGG